MVKVKHAPFQTAFMPECAICCPVKHLPKHFAVLAMLKTIWIVAKSLHKQIYSSARKAALVKGKCNFWHLVWSSEDHWANLLANGTPWATNNKGRAEKTKR